MQKRSIFYYAYCAFGVVFLLMSIMMFFRGTTTGLIREVLGIWVFDVVFITILVSYGIVEITIMEKQKKLPVLKSQAVLIEKMQENNRSSRACFLLFELDDGDKKLFSVSGKMYAKYLKNDTGLLKYKLADNKRWYLKNEIVKFEKQ